jgi:hypothetical protein
VRQKVSKRTTGLDISEEDIGPALAEKYLALNKPGNRRIVKRNIDWLRREMAENRFQPMNGDTIRFNTKGELIDGQHRLHAIIATGKTYPFIVVRGVPESAFTTIDEGITRTIKDYLSMLPGLHYYNENGSAIRWCMLWYNVGSFLRKPFFTTTEKLEWYKAHPALQPLVQHYGNARSALRMSIAMQASCHYIIAERSPKLADEYMTALLEGLDMRRGDPRYTVREWIIKNRQAGSLYFTAHAGHVILRGWNYWRRGESWANVKQPDLPPEGIDK